MGIIQKLMGGQQNTTAQQPLPSVEEQVKRNFFRVEPTAEQAQVVGASPMSTSQQATKAQQYKAEGIKPQKPIDPQSSTDGLQAILGNWTSPEEEEKYRKTSAAKQRILALGDAMRHLGNLYFTTRYSPSQSFSSPVEEEKRRYLGEKSLRDRANEKIISYQQAKQAQDMKAKELGWKIHNDERNYNLNREKAKNADENAKANNKSLDDHRRRQDDIADKRVQYQKERDENTLAETKRHHRNVESAAARNVAANEARTRAYVEEKRNGGPNKSETTLYSRRGYLTKRVGNNDNMENIIDAMYEWGKKKKYINEDNILEGVSPDIFGGKKLSYQAKQEAVNNMLMSHDDAAVQLHSKHGFEWHEQTPVTPQKKKIGGFGGGKSNGKGNGKKKIEGFGG